MQGLAIIRWVEAAVYCIELHRARLEIRARFGRALRSVQRYRVGQEHNADHIAGELSRNGVEPVKRELGRFAKVCPMQSAAMTIGFPILACSPRRSLWAVKLPYSPTNAKEVAPASQSYQAGDPT